MNRERRIRQWVAKAVMAAKAARPRTAAGYAAVHAGSSFMDVAPAWQECQAGVTKQI